MSVMLIPDCFRLILIFQYIIIQNILYEGGFNMMQEIIYGNYNKADLKQIYEKDEIKNTIFYITHLSSQIIKSLKITIENGKGSTDIVISSDDIVELVYYEDQLIYGIGRVRNIHSPETLCLDFSANYYNLVKSVPVSNIRYIRVIPKDEEILGGLHISLFELNELINGKDGDCGCPVLPGNDENATQIDSLNPVPTVKINR